MLLRFLIFTIDQKVVSLHFHNAGVLLRAVVAGPDTVASDQDGLVEFENDPGKIAIFLEILNEPSRSCFLVLSTDQLPGFLSISQRSIIIIARRNGDGLLVDDYLLLDVVKVFGGV